MDNITSTLQFVEDEGDVVFFKNARGLAQMRPVFADNAVSDSGIELDK
jgi:omega-6 fatty acid desaturase (delta-12 desaturase)